MRSSSGVWRLTSANAGPLIESCEEAGLSRPAVLFWGHEPRATGWTDPDRVAAYMYNNATGEGRQWRVPNVPFIMETFCMADHGIVSGYRRDADGVIHAELLSPRNDAAECWGLELYRRVLYAFATALDPGQRMAAADLATRLALPSALSPGGRSTDSSWCGITLTIRMG